MKKFSFKYLLLTTIFIFIVSLIVPSSAKADNFYFHGYAWSSNLGWIQMDNPSTPDAGVKYTVNNSNIPVIESGDGFGYAFLSGYAWSPNVGWVSFNETGGCPSGNLAPFPNNVTHSCEPKINLYDRAVPSKGNELNGYARVLSYSDDGEIGGNWADGWISLGTVGVSGGVPTVTNGVNVKCNVNHWSHDASLPDPNGLCSGYAWGGNVTGWIDFSNVVADILPQPNLNFTINGGQIYSCALAGCNNLSVLLNWDGNSLCQSGSCPFSVIYDFDGQQRPFPSPATSELRNGSLDLYSFDNNQGVRINYIPGSISRILDKVGAHHFKITVNSMYGTVNGSLAGDVYLYVGVNPPWITLEKQCIEGDNTHGKLVLNTNVPSNTSCTGNAAPVFNWQNGIPLVIPATSTLLNADGTVYNITCGGVSSNPVTLTCTGIGPNGDGQNKKPKYKEN